MGWQWHQLDHMEIICTSLHTDNDASTSRLSFYRPDALPAAQPTDSKHWRQIYHSFTSICHSTSAHQITHRKYTAVWVQISVNGSHPLDYWNLTSNHACKHFCKNKTTEVRHQTQVLTQDVPSRQTCKNCFNNLQHTQVYTYLLHWATRFHETKLLTTKSADLSMTYII